ncbi:MAG: HIT domain-containing protein [Patescibacteria group bacterium]
MEDCIFCKISKEVIPSTKVYEDSEFFAFMDINPVAKGHTLLIPKAHSRWMHETEDEVVAKTFIVAKNLMNKIRVNLPCDYVQLTVIGEEVAHFHVHLIPRYTEDKVVQWQHKTYSSQLEMEDYAKKITG